MNIPNLDSPAQERVAYGAAGLDAKVPGWHRKIDTEILDLGQAAACVVGQLSKGRRLCVFSEDSDSTCYSCFLGELGWRDEEALRGVYISSGMVASSEMPDSSLLYAELKPLWVAEIEKRLAADAEKVEVSV